jgi:TonB-linked SusC/RagA family outer membrane protein
MKMHQIILGDKRSWIKKLRIMKLTVILLFGSMVAMSATTYSQTAKLNISSKNAALIDVFRNIEDQSEFYFYFNKEDLKTKEAVTVEMKDAQINDVLDQVLAKTGLEYKIIDRYVVVKEKGSDEPVITMQVARKITGKVTDTTGGALPGVTVAIKGTTTGVITDNNGNYSLSNVPDNAVLVFSFVGLKNQEIPVGGKSVINVSMAEEALGIEEVVVTGYSTQRKKDITGAVAVVDVQSMKAMPSGSGVVALQGQASGVNIISSGAPGAASQIYIRGIGNFGNVAPLVLIDGVGGNLEDISANEIESLQVLKDAGSAAIYGVRGSNGVIIVTTKKGKTGAPTVSYDAYAGLQLPFSGNPLNMANTEEYIKLFKSAIPYHGFDNGIPDYMYRSGSGAAAWAMAGDPAVDPAKYKYDPITLGTNYIIAKVNKQGTNWYQEIFKPAVTSNQDLTVSGGTEKAKYLLSLGYLDQKGTLIETYLKRYSFKVNTEYNVGKHIRIGENLYIIRKAGNGYTNTSESNAVSNAMLINPLFPVYDISGKQFAGAYSYPITTMLAYGSNPVANQKLTNNNYDHSLQLTGNIYAEISFLKHFVARTSMGLSLGNSEGSGFAYNRYFDAQSFAVPNNLTLSMGNSWSYLFTNTLKYENTFGDHKLSVLAGSEANEGMSKSVYGYRQNFLVSDADYLLLQNGSIDGIQNGSGKSHGTLFSLFGRADYSYLDKYLLALTIRRDGSSSFGPKSRYGYFPSVSVGWRLSGESFLKNISWLNDLKIRASYGQAGNASNVNPNNAYSVFGTGVGKSYYDIAGSNNSSTQGFYASQLGNDLTSWEKDIITNFGLDGTILNNKIEFSAEYYKKSIEGLLFDQQLLATAGGAAAPKVNIGDIQNNGLDISVTYRDKFSKDLSFNITANITSYNNKVVSIPGQAGYFDTGALRGVGNVVRNQVGHPVGAFFGYKVIGIFKDAAAVAAAPAQLDKRPGVFQYDDTDGKPGITAADRVFMGSPNPDYTYGVNIGLNYKNFDFSTVFYGSQGNEIFNQTKFYTYFTSFFQCGLNRNLLNAWSPTNTGSDIPVLLSTASFSENTVPNSWFIEDGSFFKCRLITLGYTLPPSVLKKLTLQKLRVYLQAVNPFQITKYSGLDPEIPGSTSAFGIDVGNYPNNQRQFNAGISLSF